MTEIAKPKPRRGRPRPAGTGDRPPKIDPDKVSKALAAIRNGVRIDDAAVFAGIPRTTFFQWMNLGRRSDSRPAYREFAAQVDEALATFETNALLRINQAGGEQWQALAWMLERKFPERYGRRTRVEGNVTVTAVPMIDPEKGTREELMQLRALLAKLAPDPEQLQTDQRPALELVAGDDVIDGEAEEIA